MGGVCNSIKNELNFCQETLMGIGEKPVEGEAENPNFLKEKMTRCKISNAKIIHLSDLHIGFEGGEEINKKVERLFQWIAKKYEEVDEKPIIVITGDCVDNGEEKEMDIFADYLKILKDFEVKVAVGNHDCGPMGTVISESSHDLFRKRFEEYMNPYKSGGISLYVVDSMEGRDDNLWSDGAIGEDQRAYLRKQLKEDSENCFRILMMHHHPFYLGLFGSCQLDDTVEFMDVVFDESVELVLIGHKHEQKNYECHRDGEIVYLLASGSSSDKNDHEGPNVSFLEITLDQANTRPMVVKHSLDINTEEEKDEVCDEFTKKRVGRVKEEIKKKD